MTVQTNRAPSPWPGSEYSARRWAAAAAAFSRLAMAAIAMHRAGGRLAAVDDGFVIVEYPV